MKNIPNYLTVLRLFMIALFVLIFFAVHPLAALAIYILSGITDVLDGYLARRNGWITPLGKVLDPMADKLMQGAVLVTFTIAGYLPWWLIVPFFVKEIAQGILGLLMFRRRSVITVSRWYGKFAITLFFSVVIITVFLKWLWPVQTAVGIVVFALWSLTLLVMMIAFIAYLVLYIRMADSIKKQRKGSAREDASV